MIGNVSRSPWYYCCLSYPRQRGDNTLRAVTARQIKGGGVFFLGGGGIPYILLTPGPDTCECKLTNQDLPEKYIC